MSTSQVSVKCMELWIAHDVPLVKAPVTLPEHGDEPRSSARQSCSWANSLSQGSHLEISVQRAFLPPHIFIVKVTHPQGPTGKATHHLVFHPCREKNIDISCRLLLMAVGISQGPTDYRKVCSEQRRQSSKVFFPLSPNLSPPGALNHRWDGEPPSLHAKIICQPFKYHSGACSIVWPPTSIKAYKLLHSDILCSATKRPSN